MNEKRAVEYCKRLVNMPYNKLNLANYKEKLAKLLKIKINFIESKSSGPIKLMSGQQKMRVLFQPIIEQPGKEGLF